jgi:hypothetical protein
VGRAPRVACPHSVVSLFCRHNRFTADCPICSRGTLLEETRSRGRAGAKPGAAGADPPARAGREPARGSQAKERPQRETPYRGRYGSAGPYERDGSVSEVRLERVPGGLRLGEWSGGRLMRRAPVMAGGDLAGLVEGAAEAGALTDGERDELLAAVTADADRDADGGAGGGADDDPRHGASPGRSGELREELRVERVDGERVRVARWVLRPGTGWEMLDAPPMLPARRYVDALGDAAAIDVLG